MDELTGLIGPHIFTAFFAQSLREIERSMEPLSLLFFEVDEFDTISDRYGQQVRDQVVCTTAETLKEHLRVSDIISREQGGRFCVILRSCWKDDAYKVAENIRVSLKQKRILFLATNGSHPGEKSV